MLQSASGGGCVWSGGLLPVGGRGWCVWSGGVCSQGVPGPGRGVSAPGGVSGPGGGCLVGGGGYPSMH